MTSHVATVAFQGIEALPVDVQAHFLSGQVQFTIVGLGDKAVAESRERVRAALHAVGLALDGSVSGVTGRLPAAIAANGRGQGIICPKACGSEAAWAEAAKRAIEVASSGGGHHLLVNN